MWGIYIRHIFVHFVQCGVCVWFKQPHLAQVRLISMGLSEDAHMYNNKGTKDKPACGLEWGVISAEVCKEGEGYRWCSREDYGRTDWQGCGQSANYVLPI